MKLTIAFVFLNFSLISLALAQQTTFEKIDTVKVSDFGAALKNPWAGGLNFAQFSSIDLNLDGINDLFVFDRTGNKITTYLNGGTSNAVDYKHAPEYQDRFPALHDWVQLADYNCDGKQDIFSYSVGGIEIYKNVSNTTVGLKFEMVEDLLLSNYYPPSGTPTNIYANYADIPAISDIDNDGDLDVVNISFYSITPEYHQNKSMEIYGVCDSLNKFERNTACWGNYSESSTSNDVTLGISCKGSNKTEESGKTTHTLGSCFLCLDIDGDGDKDIAQGIENAKNYVVLTNGGTVSSANMVSKDLSFPSDDQPVDLGFFPCGYHLDVNNDNFKDLIVSSSSQNVSENFTSVLYYKNLGGVNSFSLSLQQNNFLQDGMIEVGEGAYPVFFDADADGLLDLLIGNYGYYDVSGTPVSKIALYKNVGTSIKPEFDLVTRDYANLSSTDFLNLCPAFGDLDGDNDQDMIIGEYNGKLHYYQNTAGAGNAANFVLSEANYRDAVGAVIDVGQFAVPQIVDVNKDGVKDLIIGSQNGKITYYINNGTVASPSFDKVTSNFAGVKVAKPGHITGFSHPFLFESGNSHKLIVGSQTGYLYYYDSIEDSTSVLVDSMYLDVKEGIRVTPYVADINNDGLSDMVVGNYAGGLGFYIGKILDVSVNENNKAEKLDFGIFPNPASSELSIHFNSCISVIGNYLRVFKIYDITGREIVSQAIIGCDSKVNISDLHQGMYMCKVFYYSTSTNDHYQLVKKLIVQK